MDNNLKKIKLSELASLRSQDKLNDIPEGYMQVEAFNNGSFNTKEFVSPWNLAANNVNSKIMLVGQEYVRVCQGKKTHKKTPDQKVGGFIRY